MEFGLFSNGQRNNTLAAQTYADDLHEIVVADRLGFKEAWISEHIGLPRPDTLPAPELLICQAASLTKRIRLGPAVRLLPLYHPIDVATTAAVCDHLTGGRYLFGFGSGVAGLGLMQQRGMSDDMRHPRMQEAIDLILRCWTAEEPFDHVGTYWQGTKIDVQPKPLQKPHPPIGVATRDPGFLRMAAEQGFMIFLSQYDNAEVLRARVDEVAGVARSAGRELDRGKLRLCRFVYVADSVKKARDDLREGANLEIEDQKANRPGQLKNYLPPSGRVEDASFDTLADAGMFIIGDPDTVYQSIKDLHDTLGGFGTLLLIMGKDWSTRHKRARSMRLFMQEVAPRLERLRPDVRLLAAVSS